MCSSRRLAIFINSIVTYSVCPVIVVQILTNSIEVFAGAIPLKPTNKIASDLFFQEKPLSKREAQQLRDKKSIDISKLDPDSKSEIWTGFVDRLESDRSELNLSDKNEQFEFQETRPTRIGNIRLNVSQISESGVQSNYVLLFGVKAHNILLRKAILRKLGYYVPPVQHLSEVVLKFRGPASRDNFIKDLSKIFADALGSPDDWITNIKSEVEATEKAESEDGSPVESGRLRWIVDNPEDEKTFILRMQDAIIFNSEDHIYNLSRGFVSENMIGDSRRVFNALILPLTLVDIPESVNLFSWCIGSVGNGNLILPYSETSRSSGGDDFTTSYEDAKWILRQMLKLNRKDYEDIVSHGMYPEPVAKLIVEKLISRRNCLRKQFKLQKSDGDLIDDLEIYKNSKDLDFDEQISFGDQLVSGQLTQQRWLGHASQYSFDNPESPISSSELWSYVKSEGISNIISNLVSEFNTQYFPNTTNQILEKVRERQIELALEQFKSFLTTGKVSKVPFGLWTTPIYTGNLLLNRELVIGSYLGTDNKIQLVDSIGFSLFGGQFIGSEGLKPKVSLSGQATGSLTRIYSHVKPILSMKRALNEPFKNLLVPLLQKNYGIIFDELLTENFESLEDKEKKKKLTEVMESFYEQFSVGESIIITNSLGGKIEATAGYSLAEKVSAHLTFNASQQFISRIHIHRRNDNTIQIYDDGGNLLQIGLSAGISAYQAPILRIYVKRNGGKAQTRFFSLNIENSSSRNPDLITNLKAIRNLLVDNSFKTLESLVKPYKVQHDFVEWDRGGSLLFFRAKKLSGENAIKVTTPSGFSRDYIQSSTGYREGKDYINFATDAVNAAISEETESSISLSTGSNGNPGDTFWGNSTLRQVSFDSLVSLDNTKSILEEGFSFINYKWKGWKANKKTFEQIIDRIHAKLGIQIIEKLELLETEELQLYSLDLNFFLYEESLENLLELDKKIDYFLENRLSPLSLTQKNIDDADNNLVLELNAKEAFKRRYRKVVEKIREEKNPKSYANLMRVLIDFLESELTFAGFLEAVGGVENIFVNAVITGFRLNDPNGDNRYLSNTLGFLGERKVYGPIQFVQQNIDMADGEFYAYWLRTRL